MTNRRGWTVDVIELPPPAQGSRRSARHDRQVIAVSLDRQRVIRETMSAAEVETFDPDMHWRGVIARRKDGRA